MLAIRNSWNLAERTFVHDKKIWHPLSSGHYVCAATYEGDIDEIKQSAEYSLRKTRESSEECNRLIQQLFSLCRKSHISLRTYYERGFHNIALNNNIEAMDQIQALIDYSHKSNSSKYLTSQTFEQLGIACSLSLEYSRAIEALTEAIEQVSDNKNAYFERAIAYFELKQFDLAARDFILSGKENQLLPAHDPFKILFSQGLVIGAGQGLYAAASELPSSLLYSINGLGQLLWAGITDPIAVPEKLIDATTQFIEYLRKEDLTTLAQDMAPELYDLVTNWDTLNHKTRGEKAGFVLGKYGVDIFCAYGTTKFIQAYKNLRQTNSLCNLKTLTVSTQHQLEMLQATEYAAQQRALICASKKLDLGKQGKHLIGHNSYETLPAKDKVTKSIWTHPDLEGKINQFLGKGQAVIPSHTKRGYVEFGAPGYRERVDFGEVIGTYIDIKNGNKEFKTTQGIIHHSKDGVHVVPCAPKEFNVK